MSIASEISRIQQNVTDSLAAVANKGVTVPSGSNSDDLAGLIALIPTGGGGMSVVETPDSHGGTIVTITGEEVKLQTKTATPTTSSQTISPDSTYTGLSSVTVNPIPSQYIIPTGTKSISANGTGIDVTSYAAVDVAVPSSTPVLQDKTNIAPTESSQTITPDTGYDGLSSVQINAVSSTYVGSGITRRDSTSLSADGATVSVPSGYYASNASKSVASGTVTAPSSISGSSATVSTGTNTITLSKTISVTPSVTTAGYVSSGTAGNSSVSLTASVTTKGAATITPTTTSQTIASGTYLTGTQTIAAIPSQYKDVSGVTATAGDVVSGKSFVNSTGTVNGSLVIQTYYTGSSAPSSSLGVNGDIYLQTS